jgi:hypothetical protein
MYQLQNIKINTYQQNLPQIMNQSIMNVIVEKYTKKELGYGDTDRNVIIKTHNVINQIWMVQYNQMT